MVQTGDPTGTGRGGTSIYGQKLYVKLTRVFSCCFSNQNFSQDEIHPELRFTGAGILAMANSGPPNTNGKSIKNLLLLDPDILIPFSHRLTVLSDSCSNTVLG